MRGAGAEDMRGAGADPPRPAPGLPIGATPRPPPPMPLPSTGTLANAAPHANSQTTVVDRSVDMARISRSGSPRKIRGLTALLGYESRSRCVAARGVDP